jgi:hypothetical protein
MSIASEFIVGGLQIFGLPKSVKNQRDKMLFHVVFINRQQIICCPGKERAQTA